jgi:hypothetical protein
VVDGQQRLRTIIAFGNDDLRLTAKSEAFAGKTYSTLDVEDQEIFLGYAIATDQLVNASDRDVLEAFARLNSYTVVLNAAERRHALFQGEFKTVVHDTAQRWTVLWDTFNVLSTRDCVRMQNDELFAQMYDAVLNGLRDFSQDKLTKLYRDKDKAFDEKAKATETVNTSVEFIVNRLGAAIEGKRPLSRSPQFLMLFAAVVHALFGLPKGDLKRLPPRDKLLGDVDMALTNLDFLNELLDDTVPAGEIGEDFGEFYDASRATTQRIRSRESRFSMLCRALGPQPIF